MSTDFKIVRDLAEQTGMTTEHALGVVKHVVEYLLERTSQASTRREIAAIVQEPADATLLERLAAAIAPPFTNADVQVVAEVLDQGMDIHTRLSEGVTLLHLAVRLSRLEIVRLLLIRGADPNALDHHQQTPLQLLASLVRPNPDLATLLLDAGAQPDLYTACVLGNLSQAQALLAANPSLAQVHFGWKKETALHVAAARGNVAVTQLLIDSGAQVQARNHQAVTPLHLAAANHQLEVAQALLQHGADPNAQTTFGATPLDLAIKFGRLQDPIVALLRNHGGKRCLETRLIKWEIFSSRLKHYYEQSESEVEFSFAEDGSCIESFNVWPKDTPYCIPKVSLHREAAFQDEALATLKAIFFPKEAIWIHEISQGGTNGDVFLEVEIIEEAVNDPGGKWPLAVAVNPEPMS